MPLAKTSHFQLAVVTTSKHLFNGRGPAAILTKFLRLFIITINNKLSS